MKSKVADRRNVSDIAANGFRLSAFAIAAVTLFAPLRSSADVFPRVTAADGTVISHRSGEEARYIDISGWNPIDVDQNLLAGDTLRTNAAGSLAIRFTDKTIVRLGRNSTLIVRKISSTDAGELELDSGALWARAARGGSQLKIDTPAATAAIRGTDWALRVDGKTTTLTVFEGKVELTNAQGTVVVNQGEGASATIGQAPRKYTLVNLKEREQMLLYSETRGVFAELSPSGLSGKDARSERDRIQEKDPGLRTDEEWLRLAEISLSLNGRQATRDALSQVRLTGDRQIAARVKLLEALLAGQEGHYPEAIAKFSEALPGVPANRKGIAAYGLWYAKSLAEPNKSFPMPKGGRAAGNVVEVLAQASAVSHLTGAADAIEYLKSQEARFPDDARIPAAIASLSLELDRRDDVNAALERARRIDPEEPSYLLINGRYRATIEGDLDGALADLKKGTIVAPGADDIWNELGIVQDDRGAIVESDAAYKKAISLNPENPALHANYARFLMDNDQVEASKREIDAGEKLDPGSYAVLAAKGRYLLRIGKTQEGEKVLQEANAVNPTYGDALIGLAIADYQQKLVDETNQALDNADRFDPENAEVPLIRAGIALDRYNADEAIVQAREAVRRRQLRGGFYSGYSPNRQATSFLGVTLSNVGMDEWGQYYADRAFDPFKSTTYIDEAVKGRTSPFVGVPPTGLERFGSGSTTFSSQLQGLVLDPLSLANEYLGNSLERRSFFEGSIGGNILEQGGGTGYGGDITLQGTSYAGIPVSYYIQGQFDRPKSPRENNAADLTGGLVQLGIRPSLADNFVFFANDIHTDKGYPGQIWNFAPFNSVKAQNHEIGGVWSHTISDRNIVQAIAVSSETDSLQQYRNFIDDDGDVATPPSLYRDHINYSDQYFLFGLAHIFGAGPATVKYGGEYFSGRSASSGYSTRVSDGAVIDYGSVSSKYQIGRVYADATFDATDDLKFEAGVFKNWFNYFDPLWKGPDYRVGAAWSPFDGQWLRAYYREDTQFSSPYTLSPISTVGLTPMELSLYELGQTKTAGLRLDSEWNDRLFTSIEYQHQRFNGLNLPYEDALFSFDTTDGVLNRLSLSSNYWIGGGLGAFASVALYKSEDLTPGWEGFKVPLIPDYQAQVGLKYVTPWRVTATVAQNFVGRRIGGQYIDDAGISSTFELGAYSTTDAALSWVSEDKHLEWGVQVTNIFNHRIDMADGIPARGRAFKAMFRSRF